MPQCSQCTERHKNVFPVQIYQVRAVIKIYNSRQTPGAGTGLFKTEYQTGTGSETGGNREK